MASNAIYERTHGHNYRLIKHPNNLLDMNSKTSWKKLAQKTRVPIGTFLGVIFLLWMYRVPPSPWSLGIGSAIALAGALLRLWAAGHIEKGRVLAQSGPYAYTRNPLYLGSLIMALGIIGAGQGYWLLLPFGIFFISFYLSVMRAEEQDLFHAFGEEFLEYSKRVPLFFPRRRVASLACSTFLWSRVRQNREHRNLASLVIVEALLLLRLLIGK
jgi:protein-S-isoprenylcysteine O-methyltransferase Ste14